MIGVDGQYSMNDLKIRCSCILKRVDANELVVMDELWYPDPKAFTNMSFGSDHLLLFSRNCMSMGAYNEVIFEFSVENTGGDSSNPLGEVRKCAVHLITFKDMLQEHDNSASPPISEKTHNPDLEFSEASDETEVPKTRPYETEFLLKEQPNPKRVKFLPLHSARKRHSKLLQPNVTLTRE
ncbi:unnamed protein product [Microthlaspi erraticum]|uniref:Uncharacterized protein n=1 Tax=Microthlaspi erraticum TaxID=1685480 RepID=A0A6D2L6Y2_9BRAS|nr:unnamed protein product [Microthlaspi erraticum]